MKWRLKFEDYVKMIEARKRTVPAVPISPPLEKQDGDFNANEFMYGQINFNVRYINPDLLVSEIIPGIKSLIFSEKESDDFIFLSDEEAAKFSTELLRKKGKAREIMIGILEKGLRGEGPLELHFHDTSIWSAQVPSAFLVKGPASFHQWIEKNIYMLEDNPIFMNNFGLFNIEMGYWGGNEDSFYWVKPTKSVHKIELKYDNNTGSDIYKAIDAESTKMMPGKEEEELTVLNALNMIMVFNATPELQLKMVETNPEFVNNIKNPTVEAQEKAIKTGGKKILDKLYWPLPEIKEKYKHLFSMKRAGILKNYSS